MRAYYFDQALRPLTLISYSVDLLFITADIISLGDAGLGSTTDSKLTNEVAAAGVTIADISCHCCCCCGVGVGTAFMRFR